MAKKMRKAERPDCYGEWSAWVEGCEYCSHQKACRAFACSGKETEEKPKRRCVNCGEELRGVSVSIVKGKVEMCLGCASHLLNSYATQAEPEDFGLDPDNYEEAELARRYYGNYGEDYDMVELGRKKGFVWDSETERMLREKEL